MIPLELDTDDLPEGWASATLAELLDIVYGKALKAENRAGGEVPVYGSNGIVGWHNEAFAPPTIVIGRKGSIGEIHRSERPCWPIDTTFYVAAFRAVSPSYAYYALRLLDLGQHDASSAIPGISRDDLYNCVVPVPPHEEQTRIIAKVESLLSRVQAAKDRHRRVLSLVMQMRQSVLDAAITGSLTEEWRNRNLANHHAKSDLTAYLSCAESVRPKTRDAEPTEGHETLVEAIPKEWMTPTLDALFRFIDYRGKTPKKTAQGKRLISAKNIKMGYISEEPIEYVSNDTYHTWMTRGFPKKGDIFFVTEGHTMGFVALNNRDDEFALAQRTITLQPWQPLKIKTKCYLYFLMSPVYQKLVALNATGSAAVGIKAAKFRGLPIPFPSIAEQEEIARKVDAILTLADAIQRRVVVGMDLDDTLQQSILLRAFRGELVPTEAELARLEGRSFETASELLQRVKAESQAGAKSVRGRKETHMAARSRKSPTQRKPLIEVLVGSKRGMASEQLFEAAGFDEDSIEQFYTELRDAIQKGAIREERPNKTDVILKAV
jgi:type I restriction enzyme S subunit